MPLPGPSFDDSCCLLFSGLVKPSSRHHEVPDLRHNRPAGAETRTPGDQSTLHLGSYGPSAESERYFDSSELCLTVINAKCIRQRVINEILIGMASGTAGAFLSAEKVCANGRSTMIRKTVISVIVAAGLLGGIQAATAQTASRSGSVHVYVVLDARDGRAGRRRNARGTCYLERVPDAEGPVRGHARLDPCRQPRLRASSRQCSSSSGRTQRMRPRSFPSGSPRWPSFRRMTSTRPTSCTRTSFASTRRDRRRTRCPLS